MKVTPLQPGFYRIDSDSGKRYYVDLTTDPPRCSCPSHEECKHLRRVLGKPDPPKRVKPRVTAISI